MIFVRRPDIEIEDRPSGSSTSSRSRGDREMRLQPRGADMRGVGDHGQVLGERASSSPAGRRTAVRCAPLGFPSAVWRRFRRARRAGMPCRQPLAAPRAPRASSSWARCGREAAASEASRAIATPVAAPKLAGRRPDRRRQQMRFGAPSHGVIGLPRRGCDGPLHRRAGHGRFVMDDAWVYPGADESKPARLPAGHLRPGSIRAATATACFDPIPISMPPRRGGAVPAPGSVCAHGARDGASFGRSAGGFTSGRSPSPGGIAMLSLVFSPAMRKPQLGTSFMLFCASGCIPFATYRRVSARSAARCAQSRARPVR